MSFRTAPPEIEKGRNLIGVHRDWRALCGGGTLVDMQTSISSYVYVSVNGRRQGAKADIGNM